MSGGGDGWCTATYSTHHRTQKPSCEIVWYGLVWYGMVEHSMVWYGIPVWYGIQRDTTQNRETMEKTMTKKWAGRRKRMRRKGWEERMMQAKVRGD